MVKKAVRTKKQHFVPRFYIERFTDDDNFIWSYDFEEDKVFRARSKDTGLEQNFYSPETEGGERYEDLEILFSQLESDAAPLFEDLLAGRIFEGEEREKLAIYLATQYTRSPMLISNAADMKGQMVHHLATSLANNPKAHENSMDKYDKERGKKTSAKEREEMREFLLDPKKYTIGVLRHIGLPVIAAAAKLAELMVKMNWIIVEVQSQHLITSDSPIVKSYDPKTCSVYGDGGFFNKTMYVTFPLSPIRMLEMSWMGKEDGVVRVGDKQRGRNYNRQRAYWAKRFLYASCRDDGIVALGNKLIKGGVRPRIVTGGELPKIEVKRNF